MSSPVPIKPLEEVIQMVETAASWVSPPGPAARVVGVALITFGMSEKDAADAIAEAREKTGLVVFDPIRTGCGEICDLLLKLSQEAE